MRPLTRRLWSLSALIPAVALLSFLAAGASLELRPGLWTAVDVADIPFPVSGHQVYLLGEMHGINETEEIFFQYLSKLYAASGVRDVAVEEDGAYQLEAQAYVSGRTNTLPPPLCLRSAIFQHLRKFNEGRSPAEQVRVRLVDIDSPADAIRAHLLSIRERIPDAAASVRVPEVPQVKLQGLNCVYALQKLTTDPGLLGELRTVDNSVRCLREGLEIGLGEPKGSPYIEEREETIARNIADLVKSLDGRPIAALYGSDHVSKSRRRDGGPERKSPFAPMAMRLETAGLKVFSVVTFPLSGTWSWRGRTQDTLWSAADGRLDDGRTLDRVLAPLPDVRFLYADLSRHRLRLPSQEVSAFRVDAFLAIVKGTPMENHCAAR